MKIKLTRHAIAGLLLILVLSGCGGEARIVSVVKNAQELTAVAQAQQGAETSSKDFVLIWEVFGTPTPGPTLNAQQSAAATAFAQKAQTGGTSGNGGNQPQAGNAPAQQLLPGDPRRGELVFQGAGTCMTCHDTANGIVIVGPSLKDVSEHAAERGTGKSVDDYLHESILNPDAFVVEGFNPVMPKHFGTALTPQQIEDLIAYLKSL